MEKLFKDKVVLVTGSGRGLGAAMALRFAQEGARVIINDLNLDSAQQTAQTIEQQTQQKTLVSNHEVSETSQAQAMIQLALQEFGQLDVVINNAGITRDSLLVKLSEEKWDEVIRVNLKGVFNVGQATAKAFIEQKNQGVMINIASIAYLGNIGQTNYSAAKAGVVGLSATWALELARYGIRVNCIAPGFIDSVLTQQVPPEIKEKFIQRIPLKRIGMPSEIAALTVFLASNQASYITGQCIHIDGGLTCGISF